MIHILPFSPILASIHHSESREGGMMALPWVMFPLFSVCISAWAAHNMSGHFERKLGCSCGYRMDAKGRARIWVSCLSQPITLPRLGAKQTMLETSSCKYLEIMSYTLSQRNIISFIYISILPINIIFKIYICPFGIHSVFQIHGLI